MGKKNNSYLSIVAIVLSFVALIVVAIKPSAVSDVLGFASQNTTIVDTVSHTATTTAGVEPWKAMASSTNRIYGAIQNDNTSGVVWLYFGDFQSTITASTTVLKNTGYRLDPGDTYTILPENTYTGAIWATSSASGLSILVTEK